MSRLSPPPPPPFSGKKILRPPYPPHPPLFSGAKKVTAPTLKRGMTGISQAVETFSQVI